MSIKNKYNHLYKDPMWQALRKEILRRDGYECQQTGVLLTQPYPMPRSPVVDHIIPHKGDLRLFWDRNNLQSVSKEYHDSVKQQQEKRGYVVGYTDQGKPKDPMHPWNARKIEGGYVKDKKRSFTAPAPKVFTQ